MQSVTLSRMEMVADGLSGNSYFLSGSSLFEITDGLSGATDFFFQVVFAATAVTIASGAMAGRTKFSAYLMFAGLMTAFIYPVVVHWTWGGGLIAEYINWGDAGSYSDFAGSGIVHLTGGVAAFMGAKALGPRIGKYDEAGKPRAIPGHNIVFTVIGVFILWLGWFGFNPGSELAADGYVMSVAVNTLIAAAAGGAVSAMVVMAKTGKPDVGMVGNGVLGGLVGITAGCGAFNTFGSLITGAVAGALVVYSVFTSKRKALMILSEQYPSTEHVASGVCSPSDFSPATTMHSLVEMTQDSSTEVDLIN